MFTTKLFTYMHSPRGSALLAVTIIALIASVMMLGLLSYVKDIVRINEHGQAVERAEMTADAGLHLLISYFDHWEADDPETLLIDEDESYYWPSNVRSTIWPLVNAFFDTDDALDPSDLQNSCPLYIIDDSINQNLLRLNNAAVIKLYVTAPRAEAPPEAQFTFYSVCHAKTHSGQVVKRTGVMDLRFEKGPRIVSPAAIISGGTTAANGQFNLYWGQAWALGDMHMVGNLKDSEFDGTDWSWSINGDNNMSINTDLISLMSATGYILDRDTDRIIDDNSWYDVGAAADNSDYHSLDPGNSPSVLYQNVDAMRAAAGETLLSDEIHELLDQFMELDNPDNGYEFWRDIAIRRDSYFRVEADGDVVNVDGYQYYFTEDNGEYTLNTDGDGSMLTISDAMEYFRHADDSVLIFFDTQDGNPPAADGSNWVDISLNTDNDTQSSGLLYVAGHLSINGQGTNALSYEMEGPEDGLTATEKVFHNGMIFTWGDYNNGGGPVVYGSVACGGSYYCGGNPNLYYNFRLAEGFEPVPVSSVARNLATVIQ